MNIGFVPPPLPSRKNVAAASPRGRKRSLPAKSDEQIAEGFQTLTSVMIKEFAALRNDVTKLQRRVDDLSSMVEANGNDARMCATHLQGSIQSGVNHLMADLHGRRWKLRQATTILEELLRPPTSSSSETKK